MSFSELGLCQEILKAIKDQGYTKATPIQAKAIPLILEKKDILAGAQTGTGKTAGFTLPLLQLLNDKKPKVKNKVRALILTPTRELAAQVGESISLYGKYLPFKSTIIFGGVGINPQKATLRKGVDIITATPGRLLDLLSQNCLDLSVLEFLILDEADRMLDMGFINDIKKILRLLPKSKQTLFFSATFSNDIKKLADSLLHEPALIEVAKSNSSNASIKQVVHYVSKDTKKKLLTHLIHEGKWEQVLVFTKTKHGANKLSEHLNKNFITSSAIHGNKSQGARTKALADFKARNIKVLVATDIAARGIDIDLLPHVINFELPNVAEDYVHRIGRTGRAGNDGVALSLVCGEEVEFLEDIEKLIKKSIEVVEIDGFTSYQKKVKAVKKTNNRGRGQRSPSSNSSKQGQNSQRNKDSKSKDSRSSSKAGQNSSRNNDSRSSSSRNNDSRGSSRNNDSRSSKPANNRNSSRDRNSRNDSSSSRSSSNRSK